MNAQVLLSYAYWKRMPLPQFLRSLDIDPSTLDLFADSGAFTVWKQTKGQGAGITVEEYADWIAASADAIRVYANLDAIGDADATARNQIAMEARRLHPMPVYHARTSLDHYLRILGTGAKRVAIGGMAGRERPNLRWLTKVHAIAADSGVKLHGFGMTSIQHIEDFPWHTVDSSSWNFAERFMGLRIFDEETGTVETLKIGRDPKAFYRRADFLRRAGVDPAYFATAKRGETASSHEERRANIVAVQIESYAAMERYCRRRHSSDFTIYLAVTTPKQLLALVKGFEQHTLRTAARAARRSGQLVGGVTAP